MSVPQYEVWGVEESPIQIEYSLVAIEEIRQEVSQGMQRFSRGGLEVGGLLYGTREGGTIRISAIQPISCEHKHGPSFILSSEDRSALAAQLTNDLADDRLDGLICVGWFVSHTKGELAMTAEDLDLFSTFFRDPWQVTLVIRPGRGGAMRAAFFVWEADGSVRADQSYREFSFPERQSTGDPAHRPDRMAARASSRGGPGAAGLHRESELTGPPILGRDPANDPGREMRLRSPQETAREVPHRPRGTEDIIEAAEERALQQHLQREPRRAERPPVERLDHNGMHATDRTRGEFDRTRPGPQAPAAPPVPRPVQVTPDRASAATSSILFEDTEPLTIPEPPTAPRKVLRSAGIAAAVLAVVGLIGILGYRYFAAPAAPQEPIGLVLVESNGELNVEWNPESAPIRDAVAATLKITDGGKPQALQLTQTELAGGTYRYKRESGEIEVLLTVEDSRGTPTSEASRFLGRPPATPQTDQIAALESKRKSLEAEIAQLRNQNRSQAAQIQQLQRTLRVLQSRLGIVDSK